MTIEGQLPSTGNTTIETEITSVETLDQPTRTGNGNLSDHPPPEGGNNINLGLWLSNLTVADGLMVVIISLGALLRFFELGRIPLSPAEAQAALASWQFLNPPPGNISPGSPAYFTFTNLFMLAGASSDAVARLVPALAGVLTVAAPWLWRGRLKPVVILITSLFLAMSPLLVNTSRTAGGDAIAIFALVLMISARLNMASGRQLWAYVFGVALGLGFTSSPVFYTGFVAFLVAYWAYGGQTTRQNGEPAAGDSNQWRPILAGAGLSFVLISTFFFLYPAGLGDSLRIFPAWLAQFGLPGFGQAVVAILAPFIAILRYEPAVFILGLPAAIWAVRSMYQQTSPATWAVAAAGLILLLILLQPGVLANTLVLLLPGYLLVGILASQIMTEDLTSRSTWAVAGGLILLGMVLLVSIGRFTRLGLWSGTDMTLLGLATVAFVLAGVVVILIMAWENTSARQGVFIGLSILLIFYQWGTGWQLNQFTANDPRERWVVAGTNDEAKVMVNLIRSVSRLTANSEYDLPIFSQVDSPVLRWYLRDYNNVEFGNAIPIDAQQAVVITPIDSEVRLPNDYFGTDFGLENRSLAQGSPATVESIIKWWLLRESTTSVDQERVIVWLRSDLAPTP